MSKKKQDKEYYAKRYKKIKPAKINIESDYEAGVVKVGKFSSTDKIHFSLKPVDIHSIISKNNNPEEIKKFEEITFSSNVHRSRAFRNLFFPKNRDAVYTAKCFDVFINNPSEITPSKHMTISQAVSKYGWRGKQIRAEKVRFIRKNIDMINKLIDDSQENLVKMSIELGFDVAKHRKTTFSKSSWKKCLKNTEHRNYISALLYKKSPDDPFADAAPLTFDDIFKFRSKTIMNGTKIRSVFISLQALSIIEKICKHSATKNELNRIGSLVHDTERMCRRQGVTFNNKWSHQRLLREHEERSRNVNFSRGLNFSDDEIFLNPKKVCKRLRKKDNIFTKISKYKFSYERKDAPKVIIKVLVNKSDFREESQLMKHCIGSYCSRSRGGTYLALNLSYEEDGISGPCTAGYSLSPDGLFRVQQVYSARNKDADPYLKDVAHNIVGKHINKKKK